MTNPKGTQDGGQRPAVPELARLLDLAPHPEGGWYRQTYASEVAVRPPGRTGTRAAATLIHYLLLPGERSAWHTVASDEIWLWHRGGPLLLRTGGDGPNGPAQRPTERLLGPDIRGGHQPQLLVPAATWQSAEPAADEEVLVSCLVVPGFDFADFRLL
jgi:predicted cupin superfamily sugar epimerase